MVLSSEYLAGLFDSEGSIGAKRTGRSGLTLILLISNTYLPVLEEVRDTRRVWVYNIAKGENLEAENLLRMENEKPSACS